MPHALGSALFGSVLLGVALLGAALLGAALLGATALGCLPIPVPKTYAKWPTGTVQVLEREGRAPIAGASVRLTRKVYPHGRDEDTRTETTGPDGRVAVVGETERKTVFPLMMHGVPEYAFVVCAEAKDHASREVHWRAGDDGKFATLEIELVEGSRPCMHAAKHAPKDGEVHVDGVERVAEGVWALELRIAGAPLKAGDALKGPAGEARVETIESQSDAYDGVRGARVRVRGARFLYGDVLARAGQL
jgi:hypothetical protein